MKYKTSVKTQYLLEGTEETHSLEQKEATNFLGNQPAWLYAILPRSSAICICTGIDSVLRVLLGKCSKIKITRE